MRNHFRDFLRNRRNFNPTRIVAGSFGVIILLGTLLLMLPAASRDGQSAGLFASLFTATSASCVTGLIVADTWLQWSLFGQTVILVTVSYTHLDVYKRQEKKRTDVIQGYRYTVALPDLHLEKISVKIDGNQLIEKADGYPEVEFNGVEMRAYQDDKKNVLLTAKAESVVLVNPGKKPS